jgi:hypothetical protein
VTQFVRITRSHTVVNCRHMPVSTVSQLGYSPGYVRVQHFDRQHRVSHFYRLINSGSCSNYVRNCCDAVYNWGARAGACDDVAAGADVPSGFAFG